MVEIRKDRKYILQFPEGTTIEEQKMAISKMEESLKSEDKFTVIDPRIKIYEAEKVIEEVDNDSSNDAPTDAPTDAPKDTPAGEGEASGAAQTTNESTDEPTNDSTPSDEGIKVEKVEVSSTSEEPSKPDLLSQSGSSADI